MIDFDSLNATLAAVESRQRALGRERRTVEFHRERRSDAFRWLLSLEKLSDMKQDIFNGETRVPSGVDIDRRESAACDLAKDVVIAVFLKSPPEALSARPGEVVACLRNEFDSWEARGFVRHATEEELMATQAEPEPHPLLALLAKLDTALKLRAA